MSAEVEEDVRSVERGLQVTFELGSRTVIGTVGDYLGEDVYLITDEDDSEHELRTDEFEIED